jgi:hypothetical protein
LFVENGNSFDDNAIALATASLLNPSLMSDDNAARGRLKYPPVEFISNEINQGRTSLKLCTSSLLNDKRNYMFCSVEKYVGRGSHAAYI